MPKISVIIPIYNVQKYLKECLNSVINQTYNNLEIICINDGSQDNSLNILEEYAQKDKRIHIINQSNQGVSAARNKGIQKASGEWIYIFDSDDFLKLTAFEELIKFTKKTKTDLICFDWYEFYNKNRIIYKENFDAKGNIKDSTSYTTWNLFFKNKYLKRYPEIRFPMNTHPMEDTAFNFMISNIVKNKSYLPKALLYYRQHDGMVTSRKNIENKKTNFLISCQNAINTISDFIKKHPELNRKNIFFDNIIKINNHCKNITGKKAITYKELFRIFPTKKIKIILNIPIIKFFYQKKISKSGKLIIKILKIPVYHSKIDKKI